MPNGKSNQRKMGKLSSGLSKMSAGAIPGIRLFSTDGSSGGRMAVGAFPIARLVYVLVYRIAGPLANRIASRAQKNKIFRNYVCLPVAQTFHQLDVKLRMRILNLGGRVTIVPKLDEKRAIEMGAKILLELIMVAIFSGVVIFEWNRSSQKEAKKQRQIEQEDKDIKDRLQDLEFAGKKQSIQLTQLTSLLTDIRAIVR